jgi:hypothetical protein
MRSFLSLLLLLFVGLTQASGLISVHHEDQVLPSESATLRSDHWAYQPWRSVTPPATDHARHPIDSFIQARLQREGLEHVLPADRVTLIRRLSFDLLGLPPTPKEVDRFVFDTKPGAYRRLVDRLLASPHFGERWGRHWLDLARYSDSDGAGFDNERSIWPYRDWVVDAFNRDLPFDRFTILQLAGDLVPGASRKNRVATGFHRNTMITEEDGVDDEEFRIEAVKNRVETTGTVWMGSTLNCVQCHDHKYDPFTSRDYYRMFAFFNNTEDRGRSQEPYLPLPTREEGAELGRISKEVAQLCKKLHTVTPALREAQLRWEKDLSESEEAWRVVVPLCTSSNKGVELKVLEDASILATGPSPDVATYAVSAKTELTGITGVRLEVLPDKSLPRNGPGRTSYGNFVLTGFTVTATALDGQLATAEPEPRKMAKATASYEQANRVSNGPIAHANDNDRGTGWGIYPQVGRRHEAVFVLAEPIDFDNGTLLNFELEQGIGNEHTLGRFRLSVTTTPTPPRARPSLTPELEEIRLKPAAERSTEEKEPLEAHFLSLATELDPVREEIDRLQALRPTPVKTLVMKERKKPRPTHVLLRGNFLERGARVSAGVPALLASTFGEDSGGASRLDFARWLVSPQNALTARVTVNRFWQQLFGRGIVETSNDFGTRGTSPSHPDLLEWLARTFVDDGWSMKSFLRLLVTSQTYRQSSDASSELDERDPHNILLARQTRLRLEAEAIRDSALTVSGLLARNRGGPPVNPPLTQGGNLGRTTTKKWSVSEGPDRFRRSLYTSSWRSSPFPFYATFDAPPATIPCSQRQQANTPLQALMMANDPMMLELAAGLGQRILRAGGDDDWERLDSAFLWCFSRVPEPRERALLQGFLDRQRVSFQQAPESAALMTAVAYVPPDAHTKDEPVEIEKHEAAAWSALARVLLNLDEFINRD